MFLVRDYYLNPMSVFKESTICLLILLRCKVYKSGCENLTATVHTGSRVDTRTQPYAEISFAPEKTPATQWSRRNARFVNPDTMIQKRVINKNTYSLLNTKSIERFKFPAFTSPIWSTRYFKQNTISN